MAGGWGGEALAGEVCCHWSLGSGRLLPLGTSPAGRRERRGGPSWPPGSGLTSSSHSGDPVFLTTALNLESMHMRV